MKVKVIKDEKTSVPFPKLMISEMAGINDSTKLYTIALFTSESKGVVLDTNHTNSNIVVGLELTSYNFVTFVDFDGKLELSNN